VNISAVIISFNSEKFLEANLRSMLEQTIPFQEIVVVDNFSCDDSIKVIESFGERVRLIARQANGGYSQAANTGIRATGSDLVLVANPDTVLETSFIARVLETFRSEPEIGLLSPLILRFDKKTVDSAGQVCSKALYPAEKGFNRDLDEVEIKEGPVFSVCGAATVFRREALEKLKIGGDYYDEDFFIFWEDFDIGWRAQLLGIKTWFAPQALVYHFRSSTLKRNFLARFSLALARPGNIKYHLVKNRYLVLIKNFRFKRNFKNLPFVFFKDLVWVTLLTFSSPKIIIPLMKSAKYFKQALRKRREIARRMQEDTQLGPG
jgi:GT2 family glycosyltransferase